MKAIAAIVVLALIACASATILTAPYVGYPRYYSAPVVSRSYVSRAVVAPYVSPYVSSYVAPTSYVSRYVAAPAPVYTSAYVSPYGAYPYLLKK